MFPWWKTFPSTDKVCPRTTPWQRVTSATVPFNKQPNSITEQVWSDLQAAVTKTASVWRKTGKFARTWNGRLSVKAMNAATRKSDWRGTFFAGTSMIIRKARLPINWAVDSSWRSSMPLDLISILSGYCTICCHFTRWRSKKANVSRRRMWTMRISNRKLFQLSYRT